MAIAIVMIAQRTSCAAPVFTSVVVVERAKTRGENSRDLLTKSAKKGAFGLNSSSLSTSNSSRAARCAFPLHPFLPSSPRCQMPAAGPTPPESQTRSEEGRHHRESAASVRLKAQRLHRALDADRLPDAIKMAADVAAELRSSSAAELSPKAYYDVYLSVCAELRLVEMYVMENARRGAPVLELYERVQETPLVLPRLYLLITAGSVYIKSMQAPAKEVLRDLVDMCAGVQHPQRGLFLRAYLSQMMKDKLPDAGIEEDSPVEDEEGGTVQDSIDFVIRNFTEMNRLWVRMQNDCSPREMELREKERLELRLLVGSNIATLSRLVSSNLNIYRTLVLPAILEQIVKCEDAIAQEYLADCVAQVFPDEFQLETLEAFMLMCVKLVRGVNMRTILVSIIDRLTRFVSSSDDAKKAALDAKAFQVFREQLPAVVKRQGSSLVLTDRLRIYTSLMKFTLKLEGEQMDCVDDVLGFCVRDTRAFITGDSGDGDGMSGRMSRRADGKNMRKWLESRDETLVVDVLTKPLNSFKSVGVVLKLENFVVLQRFLRYENQKSLAARLLQSTSGYAPCIGDVETLAKLFRYVAPLVQERREEGEEDGNEVRDEAYEKFDVGSLTHHHDYLLASIPVSHSSSIHTDLNVHGEHANGETDGVDDGLVEEDEGSFEKNQELVARIVYLCESDDIEQAIGLYAALRQELLRGGGRRMSVTLPSLVFASLRLALRCGSDEESQERVERILTFAAECVSFLPESSALLSLRLRVHVAGTAARVGMRVSRFVYDNISAGFEQYEEHITTSRDEHIALELLILCLGEVRDAVEGEAFEALCMRAVKHATRSLTRSDQCILLCMCAQLFNKAQGEAAGKCLRRALEAAQCCVNAAERVLLLMDVARFAIRIHEDGVCDVCTDELLGSVLKQVRTIVSGRRAKGSAVGKLAAARYQRLVSDVRQRLALFGALDASEL